MKEREEKKRDLEEKRLKEREEKKRKWEEEGKKTEELKRQLAAQDDIENEKREALEAYKLKATGSSTTTQDHLSMCDINSKNTEETIGAKAEGEERKPIVKESDEPDSYGSFIKSELNIEKLEYESEVKVKMENDSEIIDFGHFSDGDCISSTSDLSTNTPKNEAEVEIKLEKE